MLNSMTGFARQAAESPVGDLTCEIRSVNHRYLDVQFRLPDELRPKEIDLRQQIAAAIGRGKVECSLFVKRAQTEQGQLNEAVVAELGARTRRIAEIIGDTSAVDPMDVLRWHGVLEEPEVDAEPLIAAAVELLANTLTSLAEMRANEGRRIAAMIESRCDEILQVADGVKQRLPDVMENVRNRQRDRIAKLDVDADPARLETELALIAQKMDVDEELDRLHSHVSEVRAALVASEPVGRRLDFLMQELNREANTLGSKAADADTTKAAVDLKVVIEQMREQIQNVE